MILMGISLIQYNSGEHSFANQNITEAVRVKSDLVFNESYIVVGDCLEARKIYATYDLTVHGNISARELVVNGNLVVIGNIDVHTLTCHGKLLCTGDIHAKEMTADGFTVADSISGDRVFSGNDMLVHTTIDTNEALESTGLVVASEGIMGAGKFSTKAAIANEYFEFSGTPDSPVFEIERMEFSKSNQEASNEKPTEITFSDAIEQFQNSFNKTVQEWNAFEEDDFVHNLFITEHALPKMQTITRLLDKIIRISYCKEITNLRDYLLAFWAREEFPEEVCTYETLEPVLNEMLAKAAEKANLLEFRAESISDISDSLYVLAKYSDQLALSFEECADKIFSFIGLRYTTVKHIMEAQQ